MWIGNVCIFFSEREILTKVIKNLLFPLLQSFELCFFMISYR